MKPDFKVGIACSKCFSKRSKDLSWISLDELLEQDFSQIQGEDGECRECLESNFIIIEWQEDMNLMETLSPTLENAIAVAEVLQEIEDNEYDETAVEAFFTNWSVSDFSCFEEIYLGEQSLVQYAQEILPELYEIPEKLETYIDYEKFARDLRFDILEIRLEHRTFLFDLNI